jgi:hypothetical protein
VFDPVSNTFTLVNITVANVGNEKFHGAALAGDGRGACCISQIPTLFADCPE